MKLSALCRLYENIKEARDRERVKREAIRPITKEKDEEKEDAKKGNEKEKTKDTKRARMGGRNGKGGKGGKWYRK